MHISRSFPLIQHNQGYLHPAGALSTYFIGNYEVELAFHSTRSYAAQRAASRPRLNRWARIQFGRVHSGMFSTSRLMPLALSSAQQIGTDPLCHPLSVNWLEVMIFCHWWGIPTDWKWWFHRHVIESDDFLLEVLIFRYWRGIPTDLLDVKIGVKCLSAKN